MNKTAGRAAIILSIAIASLSLTACGSATADCAKPDAAESSTVAVNTASYVPNRFHPHIGGHSSSHAECTNS